jgi:uncharacterized alpha/beta hydrolase family protein
MKKIFISIFVLLLLAVLVFAFRGKRDSAKTEEDQIFVKRGDVIVRATEAGRGS